MCTVTLSYDQNNALARRKLAALLATGLFLQKDIQPDEPTPEEIEAHRKFNEEFLYASKVNAVDEGFRLCCPNFLTRLRL